MANINAPRGAMLIGHRRNMPISGTINSYIIPATDSTALFVGDFVKLTGTALQDGANVYRQVVTQAAATDTIVGVVVGFKDDPLYLDQIYRTASTKRIVYVADDPDTTFIIQGYNADLTADMIGLNADIYVGSGSTVTGLSGMQINLTAPGTGSAQLRMIGIDYNSELGAYGRPICYINEHQYRTTTGV